MSTSQKNEGLGTYFIVYFCILAIAGLQIVVAYQNIDGSQMFLRMLSLAIIQAGLAIMFFMHMKTEKRSLFFTLIPITVFVLLMMNMIWSDSFRISGGAPFAKYLGQ
ncbi:MAG TPA: cytochrome C oxidase subunit IV family protein [Terriglobales bacterium]|nr:cytochrome C oxidase subunit IV family protein [Terriglobales bacterium]